MRGSSHGTSRLLVTIAPLLRCALVCTAHLFSFAAFNGGGVGLKCKPRFPYICCLAALLPCESRI